MSSRPGLERGALGLIVLFGSGEMSPTGRKIHEDVMARAGLAAPVRIGILETPTGYEVNAVSSWPERMEDFFKARLKNFKPAVTRIRAWRRDGSQSTDDPQIVDAILDQNYLYCGAGSPSYLIRHLEGTRAYRNLIEANRKGTVLSLGSATAIAIGTYALPVYEIFKVGEDPHWIKGLDVLGGYGFRIAIIPHWNNTEGEDFDTRRCYMGKERFETLRLMLPADTTILGIDEQTACVVNPEKRSIEVLGLGAAHIFGSGGEIRAVRSGYPYLIT